MVFSLGLLISFHFSQRDGWLSQKSESLPKKRLFPTVGLLAGSELNSKKEGPLHRLILETVSPWCDARFYNDQNIGLMVSNKIELEPLLLIYLRAVEL